MTKYIPYTYRIYHRPTKMFYYGSKTSNHRRNIANPTTFWIDYFTSSKRVHQLIEQYGTHTFEIQRIKTFKTKEEAVRWEAKFLQRIDAAHRYNWLNMHNCDKEFTCKSHTTQTKNNMSIQKCGNRNPFYNKHHSDETKEKMRRAKLSNKNPMYAKKGELHPWFGHIHKPETIEKMKKPKSHKVL